MSVLVGFEKNIMFIDLLAATNQSLMIFAMLHQHEVQFLSGFHAVTNMG